MILGQREREIQEVGGIGEKATLSQRQTGKEDGEHE